MLLAAFFLETIRIWVAVTAISVASKEFQQLKYESASQDWFEQRCNDIAAILHQLEQIDPESLELDVSVREMRDELDSLRAIGRKIGTGTPLE